MSFSLYTPPVPMNWINNETVITALNLLYDAMKNNPEKILNGEMANWKRRVETAMLNQDKPEKTPNQSSPATCACARLRDAKAALDQRSQNNKPKHRQNSPSPKPLSWIGCYDIIIELNNIYQYLHNDKQIYVHNWNCRVGDAMNDWVGLEKFIGFKDEPKTPKQSPTKRKAPSAPKKTKRHKA